MAHQSSSSESDDLQIPSHHQALDLNSPHPSKDIIFNNNMELQQEESNLNKHEYDDDDDDDDDVVTTQNPYAASEPTLLCCNEENMALQEEETSDVAAAKEEEEEDSGRERLNRHRIEVAGRVWIPDIWGQEELLKDWIDCTAFDTPLVPSRISTAREALVQECTRANSAGLRIENREKTVSYYSDQKMHRIL